MGVSLSKQNLEWKGFSNEPAKKRETSSRITVGSCLESMLHASTRAKTTPPAHYQQSSQMSICPLFLIFPFKNCSESCWGGHNAWQVITEQSRAEAPLGISSNSGSCQKLTLHEGCRRSLPVKPSWGTPAQAQLCWEGWVSTNYGMPMELLNKGFKNRNLKSALFFAAGNPETAGIPTAAPSHADVGSSIQPQTWQLLACPSTWGWRLPAKCSSQPA